MALAGSARGNNQYRSRPGTVVSGPLAAHPGMAALIGSLVDQAMSSGLVPCGQIWGADCTVLIGPPRWSHGGHPTLSQRHRAAYNSDTLLAVWECLSYSKSINVRRILAANRSMPAAILEQLSVDSAMAVRCDVATNPNVPLAILERLSQDQHSWVRKETAIHLKTPLHILELLLKDENIQVAAAAADNPNLPRETRAMWQLARGSEQAH